MDASRLGFGVVIRRLDIDSDRRCVFVTMICERSEKYIPLLRNFKRNVIGSRKCGCPVKLCGYMLANKKWRFNVIYGLHNHDLCEKLVGHPIVCRLMPEEKEYVADMTLNLVQPKNIFATLKRKRAENISNIKQVYITRYQTNKALGEDKAEMHQLLKLMDDNSYVSRYRTCEDGVTVRDMFWTYHDSIKLFNTFPTMLIIDSTYKTKNYRLPLLEIVGFISTEKTYYVGFSFLESEKDENVTWSLQVCQAMLKDQEEMPEVVVTYRDTVLMNSVAKIFPTSYALLWTKQIKSKDGKIVKTGVIVENVMDAWNGIVNSSIKDLYVDYVMHFKKVCEKYHDLLKYVESTILDQVREKIVCALTDQLVGNISRVGLNYIFREAKRADNIGSDSAKYLKYEVNYLLPYRDNKKIVKFKYRSPSIDNEWKIEFNNFELKTGADVRVIWNICFSISNKSSARVGSDDFKIGQKYCKDVKRPTR
ncbi:protein FAR1-RELATED SEQUENCE 6-like [Lathyrus oleraceus]|uniref:protein FAR1-RELATED SEQUENCE 6-like n=1 Tax=Pisum sativum TaxID=3888 RepID=UPI0021D375C4|nr:protein FAR1-RELATED SEQUENCE 6-like [Pisum sativum]